MSSIRDDEKLNFLKAILSDDGLIGKKTRWWTGSKKFDFLSEGDATDHPAIDDEENCHGNVIQRNARLISELTSSVEFKSKHLSDIEHVERGLQYILNLALYEKNFKTFGSDVFLTFYDVATTAEEPLRKFALLRTEVAAQMWMQHYPSLKSQSGSNIDTSDVDKEIPNTGTKKKKREVNDDDTSAEDVLDFVMGIYALERVGIGHDSKEEVRAAASKFSSMDFFGIEPNFFDSCLHGHAHRLDWREYTQVLTYSFYAERTGINVHVTLPSVVKILPKYRPYKQFKIVTKDDDVFDSYADQLTMVFNVIHVLSNYGELQLSRGLLPQEALFISDESVLEKCIDFNDTHLVGEIIHCCRVLGFSCTSPHIQKGLAFLREKQLPDGSWPARDDSEEPYFKYHATMCAISALNPQRFRGFGPSDPKLYELLKNNALKTKSGVFVAPVSASSSSPLDLGCPTFANEVIPSLDKLTSLENLYAAKARAIRHESCKNIDDVGADRLGEILQSKLVSSETNRTKISHKDSSALGFIVAGQRSFSGSSQRGRKRKNADDDEWKPS